MLGVPDVYIKVPDLFYCYKLAWHLVELQGACILV